MKYALPAILLLVLSPSGVTAQEWGWDGTNLPFESLNSRHDKQTLTLASRLIRGYQNHVSPKQGARCPSFPSCSNFALRSIEQYGWFRGVLMTLERLYFRESPDLLDQKFYNVIQINGEWKIYDPPEANDILGHHDWRIVFPEYRFLSE